jgi:hypothetical protein
MAGSAAVEGAKAGAAFGPWGAAIGAGVGMVSDMSKEGPLTQVSGGGPFDSRGFLDGSQWTVSTGSSKAIGGARSGDDPWGSSSLFGGATGVDQAGLGSSPLALVALALLCLFAIKKLG